MKKLNTIIVTPTVVRICVQSPKYGHQELLVSPDKFELVKDKTWHIVGVNGCSAIYGATNFKYPGEKNFKTLYLHRLILPTPYVVDHINGNGLDCRNENLRTGTTLQESLAINSNNRPKKNYKIFVDGIIHFKAASMGKIFSKTIHSMDQIMPAIFQLNTWCIENQLGYIPLTEQQMLEKFRKILKERQTTQKEKTKT